MLKKKTNVSTACIYEPFSPIFSLCDVLKQLIHSRIKSLKFDCCATFRVKDGAAFQKCLAVSDDFVCLFSLGTITLGRTIEKEMINGGGAGVGLVGGAGIGGGIGGDRFGGKVGGEVVLLEA